MDATLRFRHGPPYTSFGLCKLSGELQLFKDSLVVAQSVLSKASKVVAELDTLRFKLQRTGLRTTVIGLRDCARVYVNPNWQRKDSTSLESPPPLLTPPQNTTNDVFWLTASIDVQTPTRIPTNTEPLNMPFFN